MQGRLHKLPQPTARLRGRGRPKENRIDRAVIDAAAAILGSEGFAALNVEAISLRAGVDRRSVQNRWATMAELTADVIRTRKPVGKAVEWSGDVRADFERYIKFVIMQVQGPQSALLRAVMSQSLIEPLLRQLLAREVTWPGGREAMIHRIKSAGLDKIDAELAVEAATDVVIGQCLIRGERAPPGLPKRIVALLLR